MYTLATYKITDTGSQLISCVPLSPHFIQQLQQFGPDLGFTHLFNKNTEPEALCKLYNFCVASTYRSSIEKLPCFDRMAIQMMQQANADPDLCNNMKSIMLDNGQTAFDYYQNKALEAEARGVSPTIKTAEQIAREHDAQRKKKAQSIFTPEKIAAEQAALKQAQKTLDPSEPAMDSLHEQAFNDLEIIKIDPDAVQESSYAVTPQATNLALKNGISGAMLQTRFGYVVQHNVHSSLVNTLNKVASLEAPHNQTWVAQFKQQMVQKLVTAFGHNEQGNIAQALKECTDVTSMYKYTQLVANGTIKYQELYGPHSLVKLKQDTNAKISLLTKRLDSKFFTADTAAGQVLAAKDLCKNQCKKACLNKIQHHEQRAIRHQIDQLSRCRNEINVMLSGNHTLSVAHHEIASHDTTQKSTLHITGNQLEQILCAQAIELRNLVVHHAVGTEQHALLLLANSLVDMATSSYSPGVCLDTMDLLHAYQSWSTDTRSDVTKTFAKQMEEIANDFKKVADFGKGAVQGFFEGGAVVADIIKYPEKIPDEIRDKIQTLSTALRDAGSTVSQHIHDKFITLTGTDKERQQAATRMLHRSERVLSWIKNIYAKLHAMSAQEIGHVAGRAAFDISSFKIAGTTLEIVNIGLQEARHAELVLQCERTISQSLENIAQQLDTMTTNFARKAAAAVEPEVAFAGMNIKNSWQVLKQEAEQIVGGGKALISESVKHSFSMEQFVSASKTLSELTSKHGEDIRKIIELSAEKCRSIGLYLPDIQTFQHVISGHMQGGSRVMRPNGISRSFFHRGENWYELAIDVWEKGILTEPGVKVYDFGRIIGITESGHPTSKVKLVTGFERLITIYPIG